MRMKKVLNWLLLLVGVAGFGFGIVMTVMAVRFSEWGRVVFYGLITVISLEAVIMSFLNLKKENLTNHVLFVRISG